MAIERLLKLLVSFVSITYLVLYFLNCSANYL